MPANYKQLLTHFNQQPEPVRIYFEEFPKLIEEPFPYQVSIGYVFFLIEQAQRRLLYGSIVKKFLTDTTVTKRIVNHFDMKRKDFLDKCEQIIGQKVPQTTLDHFENASKVRDHSMHGKEPSDSKLRTGLRDSLFYCSELHNYATQHAGFSPFGDMRGLAGRKGKLPPETSRLVLKGLGFSTT